MSEPWRFVAQLLHAPTADEWLARCRRVEAQGYAGISLPDHVGAQFAPLVALAAAASVTERCTLGTNVLANDFRHPTMLAKELATLDVLTNGRVVAGLGAGWMTADYERTGIPLDRPGVRIDRLLEAVTVLRGLWATGPFTCNGAHYRIDALDGQPKPVRPGGIPVLIGGGARRILTEAARVADIVGIGLDNRVGVQDERQARTATAAALREKLAWVREGAAGRPEPPALSIRVLYVAVTSDRWAAASQIGRQVGLDAADLLESPHALIGSVPEIVDDLRRRRDEYGVMEHVVSQRALD
ncbi:MAG TPA: TIGR03621 family F420-dependent LLM class oxidoreductase, partial [Acidimicrobiales bacterium]